LRAGLRGSDLVKQILAFSRQSEHQLVPTRIQNILKEVLKLSRSTIPSYIEFEQYIQSDCGMVRADATQIHQVAMNIITNAYHAMAEKGGKLSVTLREIELTETHMPQVGLPLGKYALLSISDTGHGMSAELVQKIFDPYFTTKEQDKGTGLGLAVVHGIVKEHNGDIEVISEIGEGSTFNVYLPLMEKMDNLSIIHSNNDLETGHERILIVDDEESIAKLEKQILERLGYHVTMMINSLEALEWFKNNSDKVDLIVSDMAMPNMSGDKLSLEIKSIRPGVPVILCTGYSDRIEGKNDKDMGTDGLLMKPIIKSDLAHMVRKVLDESKNS
jgi:CheY-like chemotaxis protein